MAEKEIRHSYPASEGIAVVPAKPVCWHAADLWEQLPSAMLVLYFPLLIRRATWACFFFRPFSNTSNLLVLVLASLEFTGLVLVLAYFAYLK